MHSEYLYPRWQHTCSTCGIRDDGALLYAQLTQTYQAPTRHYHNLQHIRECLTHLESLWHTQDTDTIALALWFHDAVYDSRARDNEARSAAWAAEALAHCGGSESLITQVCALILATEHHNSPADPLAQTLVDIDLAILGATPSRFAAYEQQIRAEYAWVDEATYHSKRGEVFRHFLQRPQIYSTPVFYERFEAAARQNLHTALAALER